MVEYFAIMKVVHVLGRHCFSSHKDEVEAFKDIFMTAHVSERQIS